MQSTATLPVGPSTYIHLPKLTRYSSCFGCILGYMATATHGSSIIWPAEAFDPLATLEAVREYKATALYGVPTMFVAELDLLAHGAVPRDGFEHLRTGIAAGSSIPAELMRKLHKQLNLTELTICYGMTETSPVSCMTTTDDPIEKRIDSVGRLLPHVQAKVVDPSDWSRTLGIDERGELAVSGYLLMKGYWGDEKKTSEVMVPDDDGVMWIHTGDEAAMDADGYVRITGRIKDLIIKGGENIHPLEVENCLFAHSAIREVSVAGLPDERYGEVVAAFVVKHEGEEGNVTADEVRSWVREKLSHHLGKYPTHKLLANVVNANVLQYQSTFSSCKTTRKRRVGRFRSSSSGNRESSGCRKGKGSRYTPPVPNGYYPQYMNPKNLTSFVIQ